MVTWICGTSKVCPRSPARKPSFEKGKKKKKKVFKNRYKSIDRNKSSVQSSNRYRHNRLLLMAVEWFFFYWRFFFLHFLSFLVFDLLSWLDLFSRFGHIVRICLRDWNNGQLIGNEVTSNLLNWFWNESWRSVITNWSRIYRVWNTWDQRSI